MKLAILKIGLRSLATLGALFGGSMLLVSLVLFLPTAILSSNKFGIGLAIVSVVLASYLIYVGYLAWLCWSPLAVRHVVGTLAFMLFCAVISHLNHFLRATGSQELAALLPLLGLLPLYVLYNWLVSYCCQRLFPVGGSPPATT